ncbi:hypothetical protein HAX54_047228, partial [Datura stramonium]|nr:hypothetical protein [Datura stramonium]
SSTYRHMLDFLSANSGEHRLYKAFVPSNRIFRCEYHSKTQVHSTENYWTLKKIIEKLIDGKIIFIHNKESANVTNNPLPAHNNAHIIGMISNDREYKQMGGMITTISSLEEGMS